MSLRRALHFVFKIGNRAKNIYFFRDILGMKVLRHEEFDEQCKASCNGPYDGKWSKTMIGYGEEHNHFVIELTYNYGISCYQLGNDFKGITIVSQNAINNVIANNYPKTVDNELTIIRSPDGYQFNLLSSPERPDPVLKVSLSSSSLDNSVKYWHNLLDMTIFSRTENSVIVGYDENQCKLELIDIKQNVNHAKAFGRIAFSCPETELPVIEAKIKSETQTILTPLVSLDTPGKATVQVVILADPDGHEICFVGDYAFRQLSQIDSNAQTLLNDAISNDKSDEWFSNKGLTKQSLTQ